MQKNLVKLSYLAQKVLQRGQVPVLQLVNWPSIPAQNNGQKTPIFVTPCILPSHTGFKNTFKIRGKKKSCCSKLKSVTNLCFLSCRYCCNLPLLAAATISALISGGKMYSLPFEAFPEVPEALLLLRGCNELLSAELE